MVEKLDALWGRLFDYNHSLLKRSGDEKCFGKESFPEVIDFYLTSQSLEVIKGFLLCDFGSLGTLLAARCFLEGLAIKKMFERGKINDLQIELLRQQVHLVEYKYYKKFDDIARAILVPEKLEKDYKDTIKFFKEKLSRQYSEKEIMSITQGEIPFLCNPRTNFRKLVGENLGEEFAELYGVFSQAVHPSTNDFYSETETWLTLPLFLRLIFDEYSDLPESEISFSQYNQRINLSLIARKYKKLSNQEEEIIKGICTVFDRFFKKNYTSDTLTTISKLLIDSCSDKLLGLSEHVKSKWKIVLDLFASFYYCYIESFPDERRYALLKKHKELQKKRNINEEYQIDEAYKLYKTIFPNGVDCVRFEKSFLTTSGYTIDEKGQIKNLTVMAKEFLEKFFTNENVEQSWNRCMLLDYVESQKVSHANGYLWYANAGSFGDINNIIIGTDYCLITILQLILNLFQIHRSVEETKQYKTIINVLRNGIKRIKPIVSEKDELLKIPGIAI